MQAFKFALQLSKKDREVKRIVCYVHTKGSTGYFASILDANTIKELLKGDIQVNPFPVPLTIQTKSTYFKNRYCFRKHDLILAFGMDKEELEVLDDYDGSEYQVACFAMICHHCGQRYVELFPNAKQENLFIGMIHGFAYMGIPKYILTDNMTSVVLHRDFEGNPVWQKDFEAFMKTVGFRTKLCKPRHPFTKGKVERLVRFVKENFLVGRVFWNITDLNRAALDWCNRQNGIYHRATDGVPQDTHYEHCVKEMQALEMTPSLLFYLCPERRISFDGFVNYEGRRFGIPYSYRGSTARIMRNDDMIYIYSADLNQLLTTHDVTWSKRDRFCADQYALPEQPEEFPSMPVKAEIVRLPEPEPMLSFEKFNFDKEVEWDD